MNGASPLERGWGEAYAYQNDATIKLLNFLYIALSRPDRPRSI